MQNENKLGFRPTVSIMLLYTQGISIVVQVRPCLQYKGWYKNSLLLEIPIIKHVMYKNQCVITSLTMKAEAS